MAFVVPDKLKLLSFKKRNQGLSLESVQDFLIRLDMKPCMQLLEISIFFTKSCHHQAYQNHEQPSQTSQNSNFQSHFSVLKNWLNLSEKKFYEEYVFD